MIHNFIIYERSDTIVSNLSAAPEKSDVIWDCINPYYDFEHWPVHAKKGGVALFSSPASLEYPVLDDFRHSHVVSPFLGVLHLHTYDSIGPLS